MKKQYRLWIAVVVVTVLGLSLSACVTPIVAEEAKVRPALESPAAGYYERLEKEGALENGWKVPWFDAFVNGESPESVVPSASAKSFEDSIEALAGTAPVAPAFEVNTYSESIPAAAGSHPTMPSRGYDRDMLKQ